MGKIVTDWHCDRLQTAIQGCKDKILYGGAVDRAARYVEPTLLDNPTLDSDVMKEEIFGPILPILTFNTIDEAIKIIKQIEKPLVVYYFGKTWGNSNRDRIINETSSGAFI